MNATVSTATENDDQRKETFYRIKGDYKKRDYKMEDDLAKKLEHSIASAE